jgi:DNA-binding transcriptional regulator YiaG
MATKSNIQTLISKAGLTQAQFAQRLNVAETTVTDWCDENHTPRRSNQLLAGFVLMQHGVTEKPEFV